MSDKPTRILVVEDDLAILTGLSMNLNFEGYEVLQAQDGRQGLARALDESPDLLVLDVMLPELNGFELLKELRQRGRDIPVVVLSAKGAEMDKILGLNLGADDYVTKPFSPKELLARIKAVLRRRKPEEAGDPLRAGAVLLDPVSYRVTIRGDEIVLGPTEFRLLQFFLANPDRVFTRDQVLDRVWGDHRFLELRTVDVYIRRLRAALRTHGAEALIDTVRGVGYRCTPSALG